MTLFVNPSSCSRFPHASGVESAAYRLAGWWVRYSSLPTIIAYVCSLIKRPANRELESVWDRRGKWASSSIGQKLNISEYPLESEAYTEFDTSRGLGRKRLPEGRGKNRLYSGDVGMIQQVGTARIEGESAWMLCVFRV